MKRKNKLVSGLTLVEVVIAMSIFSLTTLAVTTAFAACFKYNSRNVRRDYELNTQQTALEKGVDGGVQVFEDTFNNKRSIQFSNPATSASIWSGLSWTTEVPSEVTAYNAKNTEFNDSLGVNFNLKTFSSTTPGSNITVSDPANNCYVLYFENISDCDVDFRVNIGTGSKIYTGNYSGDHYETSTQMYTVTLPAYNAGGNYAAEVVDSDGSSSEVDSIPSIRYLGVMLGDAPGISDPEFSIDVIINGGISITQNISLSRGYVSTSPTGKVYVKVANNLGGSGEPIVTANLA